jgi:PIN domain nuclease of toxin-antitoxin system
VKLLLDTHALLWWFFNDPRLSGRARAAIGDSDNEVLVSAASAWEIAVKFQLGKLPEAADAVHRFEALVAADGFTALPIAARHALRAGTYPAAHRDPFDRMLAAQSELEGATLVTQDPALAAFPCARLW